MALSDSETQSRLDNLQRAKASGVREVFHNGKRLVYRDMDELDKAISDLEASLSTTTGKSTAVLLHYRRP